MLAPWKQSGKEIGTAGMTTSTNDFFLLGSYLLKLIMPAENYMKAPATFVTQECVHTTNKPTNVFFL